MSIKVLKYRGPLGLLIIVVSEILIFSGVKFVSQWFTPIVWTGYILLMDQVNERLGGWSLMAHRRSEFALMVLLSIVCWVIFETYNLHLKNWEYLNLPHNPWVRHLGYGVSFATIFPGIFQTYYFLDNVNLFRKLKSKSPRRLRGSFGYLETIGLVFLLLPLFLEESDARYLFGMVWIGFVLLLEPLNYRLGFRSIIREIERGNYSTMSNLLATGVICGILWEFWNYWAFTRWIYTLPFPTGFKIFEMPALGFLGFFPFAIECYAMFNFYSLREDLGGPTVTGEPLRKPGV